MLVLSRKVGESVRIGKNIKVRILGLNGSQIRIGIEAPENQQILRQEARNREGRRHRDEL